jgi:Chromo (CHRromatin Organisation MOdifier) domain
MFAGLQKYYSKAWALPAVLRSDQYTVEQILSEKVDRPKGCKKEISQYLVKWEGYPDDANSFVIEIHEDLIKAYTATAEQLLSERSVRLGRRKKMVTQYRVKWGGYLDDQKIWLNEDHIDQDIVKAKI